MPTWVRYSVAVYMGLLLAGSLMASKQAAAWERTHTMARAEHRPQAAPQPPAATPDPAPHEPERLAIDPTQRMS